MKDLKDMLEQSLRFYIQQEKRIVSMLSQLPKGKIRKKEINGTTYYYLRYRKGKKVVDDYLGKEIPEELLRKLEQRRKLEKELKQTRDALKLLQKRLSPEVGFLEPMDKFLKTLTEQGLWEEGLEIVGAWCFILYQNYLDIPSYPLATRDLDILIPLPYKGKSFDLFEYLRELGFWEGFNPDGSMYFSGFGMKIEFLAPERGRGRKRPPHIEPLGITPQLLRFMDLLLEESMVLKLGRGIKIKIPAPSSFLLHKLIVSLRRQQEGKKEKDIKQAVLVSHYVLAHKEEREKLVQMWNRFPVSWRKRVKRALKEALHIIPDQEEVILGLERILK